MIKFQCINRYKKQKYNSSNDMKTDEWINKKGWMNELKDDEFEWIRWIKGWWMIKLTD